MNISQIKKANKAAGQYFFSKKTNRFFNSITLPEIYEGEGGVFFVTSEFSAYSDDLQKFCDEVDPHFSHRRLASSRAYTVRFFETDGVNAGHVGTLGEFNKLTRTQAISKAKKAAAGKYEWVAPV